MSKPDKPEDTPQGVDLTSPRPGSVVSTYWMRCSSPMTSKVPQAVDFILGRNIRLRRMMKGISQTALASKIGVTFQQVQKYEGGANRVSASRLSEIAQVLGAPVGVFFDGGPNERKEAQNGQSPLALLSEPQAL